MDVYIEDRLVVDNLDVVAVTGGSFRAHVITTAPLIVSDGILTMTLNTTVGQAIISGIEVMASAQLVTHRINCGATSNTLVTMNNVTWSKDMYALSGATSNRCSKTNTTTNTIYCSSRYFRTSLGTPLRYNIPVPYNNALYVLKLHFNEHVRRFMGGVCSNCHIYTRLTHFLFIWRVPCCFHEYSITMRLVHEYMMYGSKTH